MNDIAIEFHFRPDSRLPFSRFQDKSYGEGQVASNAFINQSHAIIAWLWLSIQIDYQFQLCG